MPVVNTFAPEEAKKESYQKFNVAAKAVRQVKTKTKAAPNKDLLKLANLASNNGFRDFQDEFMSKYDEFSQSWREQIDK